MPNVTSQGILNELHKEILSNNITGNLGNTKTWIKIDTVRFIFSTNGLLRTEIRN